jgi:hypothetical protein
MKKYYFLLVRLLTYISSRTNIHSIDTRTAMENEMSPAELAALAEAQHRGDAAHAAQVRK